MPFDPKEFDSQVFTTGGFDCVFDSAFFDGRIFDTCEDIPVIEVDTHDGGRQQRGWKKRIDDRERLREQIRVALEGPQAVELREVLEPVAIDSAKPLYQRIDLDALEARVIEKIETAYRAAEALEDDDEDVLLLGAS